MLCGLVTAGNPNKQLFLPAVGWALDRNSLKLVCSFRNVDELQKILVLRWEIPIQVNYEIDELSYKNGSQLKIEDSISKSGSTVSSTTFFGICHCILKSLLILPCPTVGKQILTDIVVMMGCFIVGVERENRLIQCTQLVIQSTQLVIQLAVVSTTLHKNSFSRKMVILFGLAFRVEILLCIV